MFSPASQLIFRPSQLIVRTSQLIFRPSQLIVRTSQLIVRTSQLIFRTSQLKTKIIDSLMRISMEAELHFVRAEIKSTSDKRSV